jgi:hypothetical protein
MKPVAPNRSPRLTVLTLVEAICRVRRENDWGAHHLGWALQIARPTVVLRRADLHYLVWLHRWRSALACVSPSD